MSRFVTFESLFNFSGLGSVGGSQDHKPRARERKEIAGRYPVSPYPQNFGGAIFTPVFLGVENWHHHFWYGGYIQKMGVDEKKWWCQSRSHTHISYRYM